MDGSSDHGAGCTKTTCPYCGVGCGVLASVAEGGNRVSVSGDPDHPANFGRLCSKGSALHETLSLNERLLSPMVSGREVGWDAALNEVADRFSDSIAKHGPDSVAFYVSGQLLTEDYYVANKLMKGFIGSANIDTNSRLCMASSVAGHKRAFGSDTVPGCYEDLELADVVVLVGSNLAWCHPVLYQRIVAAKERSPQIKIVVIDPRRTATCDGADLHLPLAPGTDVALFNGLFTHLVDTGKIDVDYVAGHTSGYDDAHRAAMAQSIADIAKVTHLPQQDIAKFYDVFAQTERVVTVYSQGVNQSSSGTDKVNAIINCHLITGRIGEPGMGPFSVTGQPNAMGGREVGGLANQLASHLDLETEDHRAALQDFWQSPKMASKPGLKAVDMFRGVANGQIKAIWIMATNPVDSLPEADSVARALQDCPFVVVSDVVGQTDTTQYADVLLPAAAWGEKDGTVTNSERRISRQRSFLPLPGDAKPDWWIVSEVAKRMGFAEAFSYDGPHAIFEEYARSTTLDASGNRALNLSGFAGLNKTAYDTLKPSQWPVKRGDTTQEPRRFFGDGNFFHADGKARIIATPFRLPRTKVSEDYPMVLNTGRVRDQWHTMTRTSLAPRLMEHIGEPFCEIHPRDASRLNIAPATLVEVRSQHGSAIVRAMVTDRQQPGSVFVPMHWTDQLTARARIDSVVSAEVDPISGQPESKFTPVRVTPWLAKWFGFAILNQKPTAVPADYWAFIRADGGWCVELAGRAAHANWQRYAHNLFGYQEGGNEETLAYCDQFKGHHRFIKFKGDRLKGALFVAPEPVAVSRAWAGELLQKKFETPATRLQLLAARPGADQPDRGAIVCSCFSVGINQISEAVCEDGLRTLDEIGAHLKAGTNCGSCRPEIRRIIDDQGFSKTG